MYILNIIIHSEFLHDCHMYKFTWLYTVQVPSSAEFLLVNTISATEDMLVVSLKLFYYACNICHQVSQVVHSVNFPTFCNQLHFGWQLDIQQPLTSKCNLPLLNTDVLSDISVSP